MLLKVFVSSVGLPHVIIDMNRNYNIYSVLWPRRHLPDFLKSDTSWHSLHPFDRALLSLSKWKFAKRFGIDPASIYIPKIQSFSAAL